MKGGIPMAKFDHMNLEDLYFVEMEIEEIQELAE